MSPSPMHHIALLLLLAAAVHPGHAAGASSVITTTCAAAAINLTTTTYDYCVDTLSADPAALSSPDARGLAADAANLTLANVTSTVLVLADLVPNLSSCLKYYREMNETVAGALEDIRAGRLDAASKKLNEATNTLDDCDTLLFEGSAMKNPLSKENVDADLLSTLANDLTNFLVKQES